MSKKTVVEEVVVEEQTAASIPSITKESVKERLELIQKIVEDEHPVIAMVKAHTEQDLLLLDVLTGIVNGAEDPKDLASAALEVFKLEFTRSYS
ncbi:hypothetical protein [Neobacillus drentensis]|uniref:hypothetical protein n=1 Tax=Neobacillus drentensis TaxID=220684 RepID=UPI002FFDC6F4